MALALKPAHDAQRRRPPGLPVPDPFVASPVPPEEGVDAALPEPLHRLGHLRLEGEPPHLPVRDDGQPGFFLKGDGRTHRPVFGGLEP
ncbi:MAG: hypothetical protein QGG90_06910, partial [Nitrospinota bacterium]|nr:hypothetical protein [Nitrospinota bacterium]